MALHLVFENQLLKKYYSLDIKQERLRFNAVFLYFYGSAQSGLIPLGQDSSQGI